MASVHKLKNGKWRVQFFPPTSKKRKGLRLGDVAQRVAQDVARHIERIIDSRKAGLPLEDRTEAWVAGLSESLRGRLIELGVLENTGRRARTTLSGFVDDYLSARTDLKPGTLSNLRVARMWLEQYFDADRQLDSITKLEAETFRSWLGTEGGLAENTIRGICRKSRQLFRSALNHRLIRENPFAGMKRLTDMASPATRQFYINRCLADRVLAICPNDEWRLIFALARYGGLRIPSELVPLKWSDIDWEKEQFLVHCQKTEGHDGRETRWVPLFPEIRPFLEACFRAKDRHPEKVIRRVRCNKNNLRTQMRRILEQAGIQVWPKLFQNLRSSRESELMKVHGVELACKWIGNTPAVATKHYLQVTEDDYAKALEAWRALGRHAG